MVFEKNKKQEETFFEHIPEILINKNVVIEEVFIIEFQKIKVES